MSDARRFAKAAAGRGDRPESGKNRPGLLWARIWKLKYLRGLDMLVRVSSVWSIGSVRFGLFFKYMNFLLKHHVTKLFILKSQS